MSIRMSDFMKQMTEQQAAFMKEILDLKRLPKNSEDQYAILKIAMLSSKSYKSKK